MEENVLKILAVGDLHFGHPRISAENLYNKLCKHFYPELKNCQLVIITGDTYDQLLTVGSKAHKFASMFVNDLFRASDKTGMQIHILHGTFTHDRDQISVFAPLAFKRTRYEIIDTVACKEIKNLSYYDTVLPYTLRTGYIPDNLTYKYSSEVIQRLHNVLACQGWSTLDMLIGHGTFAHALPVDSTHAPMCLYDLDQFQMVKGPIIMGHIHTPGKRSNCYYCGSFDRMSHGEEESKGFYVFTRTDKPNSWKSRFVENTDAIPFKTIVPEGNDTPELVRNFTKQLIDQFPNQYGYVRVLHDSPEIRSLLHKICIQNFPNISYSSKSVNKKDILEMKLDEIPLDVVEDVKLDEHNIGNAIYQYLQENKLLERTMTEEVIVSTVNDIMQRGVLYGK